VGKVAKVAKVANIAKVANFFGITPPRRFGPNALNNKQGDASGRAKF
jgi:hypothetical protein